MSTYTKYHLRVKENISRLRNPGNADDGICPDRVLFTNPENQYAGTFIGSATYTSAYLSDCVFNGCEISGCNVHDCEISAVTLNDATLKSGDSVVEVSDLISSFTNVSSLTSNVDALSNTVETRISNITYDTTISTFYE